LAGYGLASTAGTNPEAVLTARALCSFPLREHMTSASAAQSKALTKFCEWFCQAQHNVAEVLSIRAASPAPLRLFRPDRVRCLQTDRVLADLLERDGFRVCTQASGEFDLCLVEATKHKDENLYHIALGWSLLRSGGHLIISVANALGAESLAKRTAAALSVRGTYSKARSRVIWIERAEPVAAAATFVHGGLALGEFREIPGTGLMTCPGLFSAHAVDQGTQLLAETLRLPLQGDGADFGAGYGALSRHILRKSDKVRRLDLYEVEWKALAAAKLNLAAWEGRIQINYEWQDVARHAVTGRYDWVVMNPPFHAGREAVPALGKAFIANASAALKASGSLWLVANRRLPYEAALAERFSQVTRVCERQGFKVVHASGPKHSRD
jgi:16S rRNA (guanine1207-N2)-methyltransferase